MTGKGPAPLLFFAAVLLAPLLSWGEPPWALGGFYLLLAGGAVAAASRGIRSPGGRAFLLPTPILFAFALAFLLGFIHLFRGASPYLGASFLLLLFWGFLFLLLFRRLSLPSGVVFPLVLAWTGGEALLLLVHLARGGAGQPEGTFTNPNHLATFFAAALAFFLGGLMERGGPAKGRALSWGAALATTACLLAVGSRSGWLVALALWGCLAVRERGVRRLAAAGVIAAVFLLPSPAQHRVAAGAGEDPYAFTRKAIWRMGAQVGADHPFIGVGPNLFRYAAYGYNFPVEGGVARFGRIATGPHSDYLRAWSEGGALGVAALLLFLLPLATAFPVALRTGRAGPALALLVFLLQGFLHDLTLSFAMSFLALFWAGLVLFPAGRAGEGGENGGGGGGSGKRGALVVLALAAILAATASVVDLAAVSWWERGRDAAGMPLAARVEDDIRASALSPFHPGIAADLGAGLTGIYEASRLEPLFDAAEKALTRARSLNRLDPVIAHRLAGLYMTRGSVEAPGRSQDLARAGELLNEVLVLSPHDVIALRHLAAVREAEGKGGEALAFLDRALSEEPLYIGAHRDRVRLLASRGPDRPPDPARALAAAQALAAAEAKVGGLRAEDDYQAELFRAD